MSSCNWFQALDKSQYFEEEGDHADEMETSIMMHIQLKLVLPLSGGMGKENKIVIKAFREKWAWKERKWSQVTEDTAWATLKNQVRKRKKVF